MQEEKYEYIQRIKSPYVGKDCIQIMIPHKDNTGISVLDNKGMLYHYKPNSNLFINKYIKDNRKEQFPYSQIPNHKSRVRFKVVEYINQLLDYNKVYIEITDGIIKEIYAVKDNQEALLAIKYLLPTEELHKYLTRSEVIELISKANGRIYSLDGEYYQDYSLITEEDILKWYKEQLIEKRKEEAKKTKIDDSLTEYFYSSLDKLTIDDIPRGITICKDMLLVSIENNQIKSIKGILIKFISRNRYNVKVYDFPITIYSLEHMKMLEQTNKVKTQTPKFPRNLNKNINREEIKKSKKLIKQNR